MICRYFSICNGKHLFFFRWLVESKEFGIAVYKFFSDLLTIIYKLYPTTVHGYVRTLTRQAVALPATFHPVGGGA